EHHHVAPVHPEYAKIPPFTQDVDTAKKLLAEAGVPDGFATEINCIEDPDWEAKAVVAMADMWKQIGVTVKGKVLASAEDWGQLGQGDQSVPVHILDAPSGRDHGAGGRLSHGRAVEREQVVE